MLKTARPTRFPAVGPKIVQGLCTCSLCPSSRSLERPTASTTQPCRLMGSKRQGLIEVVKWGHFSPLFHPISVRRPEESWRVGCGVPSKSVASLPPLYLTSPHRFHIRQRPSNPPSFTYSFSSIKWRDHIQCDAVMSVLLNVPYHFFYWSKSKWPIFLLWSQFFWD